MTTTDKLAAFDAAIAAELPRVYHLEYDSHEICKHFAGKVRERLLAAHDAEQAAQAVPAGFKWVPVEPTPEMVKAGASEAPLAIDAAHVYRTMLAAAPAAPAPEAQAARAAMKGTQ